MVYGAGGRQGGRLSRKGAYIPNRGDAVWITLDPQAGHEQAGRRPALVLSPSAYNGRVGLALFCPITTQVKGYPFEVPLPRGAAVSGVVGADQVKSLDWRAQSGADWPSARGSRLSGATAASDVTCRSRVTICGMPRACAAAPAMTAPSWPTSPSTQPIHSRSSCSSPEAPARDGILRPERRAP